MIKNYPDLYTLDKTGNIRIYKSSVHYEEGSYLIITESGRLDGILIQHTKEIKTGKVNRTPEEQAINEGQSKWNAKLDDGYKDRQMLQSKVLKNGGEWQGTLKIKEFFEELNITFNTNKDWHELPMLAQPIKKVKDAPNSMYVQPKLNGVRCIAKMHEGKILLCSRGGKYYNLPHIVKSLENIFEKNPNIILDGEIYKHGVPLGKITGAVARKEKDMFNEPTWLEYHIYDVVSSTLLQEDRINVIDGMNILYGSLNSIFFVKTELIIYARHMFYHDKFVQDGYEGAILRNPQGKYYIGFRDKVLIKIKNFIDEEFEIIGCNIDETKSIGDSFTFKLQNNINQQTFNARPRGSRKEKERWYNNIDKIIGKQATVRYQERTETGLPHQDHCVCIRDYE